MKSSETIRLYIIISLLVHILLLIAASWKMKDMSMRDFKPSTPEVVEVNLLPDPSYQIADIEPPKKEEKPKDSKFVGLYDSRVEEEKVAPSQPLRHRGGHEDAKQEKKQQGKGTGEKLALKTPEKSAEPQGLGDSFTDSLPQDFFPDRKIGDKTYLNVLRFPKIGYFVRLKKIFHTTWNPAPAVRSYAGTNFISKGQMGVVLGVAINQSGELAELFVINSSGLPAYDQEAIRTIRDSAPFAVPPSDLLDSTKTLRMVWTFTVYL